MFAGVLLVLTPFALGQELAKSDWPPFSSRSTGVSAAHRVAVDAETAARTSTTPATG